MTHFAVNWLAVVVATLASMALGFGYYTLLGNRWLAAQDRKKEDINTADYTPYIWAAIVQLVMAYFMALVTPALFGTVTVGNGILAGVHMWLGFVITSMILNHRYQGRKWSLTAIDGGYILAVLIVQGIVIGLFGGGAPTA